MKHKEARNQAIANFIMKLCSVERYIEVKRQILCDKADFEPYIAYCRISRDNPNGISLKHLQTFLRENLLDKHACYTSSVLSHYDIDTNGYLSYKEFLEIVLPKEHSDLRAFVTQRECSTIKKEEYLSYETEFALASLLHAENSLYAQVEVDKEELDDCGLTAAGILKEIDVESGLQVDFKNLQVFLHDAGILPYDAELIAFLRRVDRNGDGVVDAQEFAFFLARFLGEEIENFRSEGRTLNRVASHGRLRQLSPDRKIVTKKDVEVLAPNRGGRTVYKEDGTNKHKITQLKRGYVISKQKFDKIFHSKFSPVRSQKIQ